VKKADHTTQIATFDIAVEDCSLKNLHITQGQTDAKGTESYNWTFQHILYWKTTGAHQIV